MEYNEKFFTEMLEQSAQEEVDKNNASEILKKADKNALKELFKSTGDKYYINLLSIIGSIRFNNLRNTKVIEKLDTFKEETLDTESEEVKTPATIRLIAAKLLGLVKFTWDTTIISISFIGRVAVNLIKNLGKALYTTGANTIEEAGYASDAIKDSWNRNLR
jgi:hypothetical protein